MIVPKHHFADEFVSLGLERYVCFPSRRLGQLVGLWFWLHVSFHPDEEEGAHYVIANGARGIFEDVFVGVVDDDGDEPDEDPEIQIPDTPGQNRTRIADKISDDGELQPKEQRHTYQPGFAKKFEVIAVGVLHSVVRSHSATVGADALADKGICGHNSERRHPPFNSPASRCFDGVRLAKQVCDTVMDGRQEESSNGDHDDNEE